MNGKAVSRILLSVLASLALGLFTPAAQAGLEEHTDPRFKCPGEEQKPFCLKNNGNGSVILTGLTVYSGPEGTGDSHQVMDDDNGGDDLTITKGEHACWCVSLCPESYEPTIYSGSSTSPNMNFLSIGASGLQGPLPMLSGADVRIDIRAGVEALPRLSPGEELLFIDGVSAQLPGVVVRTLAGRPFEGWLTYGSRLEKPTLDLNLDH